FVAPALNRGSEEFLALSRAVNISGIEEVDACIECCMDDGFGPRGIDAPSEVVAADADERNVERSQFSIFHSAYGFTQCVLPRNTRYKLMNVSLRWFGEE